MSIELALFGILLAYTTALGLTFWLTRKQDRGHE